MARSSIDYFRNARGSDGRSRPYVVRSRANAPVATPIHWRELDQDLRNDHFT
jgi:DNA primase